MEEKETCPAQRLLKMLSGKWKAEIFRLAVESPLRFNNLLRQIQGSNKQSLATALKRIGRRRAFGKNYHKTKASAHRIQFDRKR